MCFMCIFYQNVGRLKRVNAEYLKSPNCSRIEIFLTFTFKYNIYPYKRVHGIYPTPSDDVIKVDLLNSMPKSGSLENSKIFKICTVRSSGLRVICLKAVVTPGFPRLVVYVTTFFNVAS